MKTVVWGLEYATVVMYYKAAVPDVDVVALIDKAYVGKNYNGYEVKSSECLSAIAPELIIICSPEVQEIINQINNMELPVKPWVISVNEWNREVRDSICKKLEIKYQNNNDPEIQQFISYTKTHMISVFAGSTGEDTLDPVLYDGEHPYVLFEGKRMYYPDNYPAFVENQGKRYVENLLTEQRPTSPHLYLKGEHTIHQGDILVDAGVCEGNFSLRYIDKVKKVYLIECSKDWISPLRRTFAPYQDKVVFVDKFLGRETGIDTVCLDDLIPENEKVDFIKMDIEGAEIDAILGAKKVLTRSNARLSLCSYHRKNDRENIEFLLHALGYQTDTSKGYMYFLWDKNTIVDPDLRKGIVYGYKNNPETIQ